MLPGLLLIVFILLLFQLLLSYYRYRTSTILNNIPGPPKKSFLFGYGKEKFENPYFDNEDQWWRDACAKEGCTVPFISFSTLFGYSVVTCLDPDIVKEILTSPPVREPNRFQRQYQIISELVGMGLLTLDGSAWHRHRRIIQPSFHTRFVKEALSLSVPQRAQTLITAWRKTAQGRTIDAMSHMSALTLDVIGDVAFSHDFHALEVVEKWSKDPSSSELPEIQDPLINGLNDALKPRVSLGLSFLSGMTWLAKYINPSVNNVINLTNEHVDKVIKDVRSLTTAVNNNNNNITQHSTDTTSSSASSKKCKSLLQLMLNAKDKDVAGSTSASGLSDIELRDELKTFMIAGHETTSVWCHWALYTLGKYPAIQQRVYEDICKHVKMDSEINAESVEKMTYMNAFLNEVLRLYPPVGFIFRVTTQEEHWKGYIIPANTRIDIPIVLLHRHPDHWPKPLEFLPERWLDTDANNARHRCCFLPFSVGGRNCIGQSFAQTEAKLIISLLVKNFEIHLPDHIRNNKIAFGGIGTMKSMPAVEITVKPRLLNT